MNFTKTVSAAIFLLGCNALAASTVEVVESTPIETNLAVPGVRATQDVWLEMVNHAQTSIDLEQFYVNNKAGESLDPIITAIQSAASRGVQVRLLIASSYYKNYPAIPDQFAHITGMQVKQIDFSSYGGIQHAKYFVVDGEQAYVGSANFDWLALTHIHEVGLHVTDGNICTQIETIFEKDWAAGSSIGSQFSAMDLKSFPRFISAADSMGLQLVASPVSDLPSGVPNTIDALTTMIAGAKKSLKIQNYEYSTSVYHQSTKWMVLDQAIRAAAGRGVQVELALDATALKAGKKEITALEGVPNIQVKIVTIPEWSGGPLKYARLIHSKYMVVDGSSAWVGSENWSQDYFYDTRNVGFTIEDPQTVGVLGQIFSQVWTSPYTSN